MGRLLRSKHTPASSALCCRALHWNGDGICVQPAVRPRQRPLKLKPEFQMDDGDVANHWKHLPLAKVRAADPTVLHRLAEASVNTLRRWSQFRNASSRTHGLSGTKHGRSRALRRCRDRTKDAEIQRIVMIDGVFESPTIALPLKLSLLFLSLLLV